jgi:hypothetical protein
VTGFAVQDVTASKTMFTPQDCTGYLINRKSETLLTIEKGTYDQTLFEVPPGFKRSLISSEMQASRGFPARCSSSRFGRKLEMAEGQVRPALIEHLGSLNKAQSESPLLFAHTGRSARSRLRGKTSAGMEMLWN